jgi:hypothetical protein
MIKGKDLSVMKGKDFTLQFDIGGKKYCMLIKDGTSLKVVEGGVDKPMICIALSEPDWRAAVTGQAEGVTIYYKVQASDASVTNLSELKSYTLDYVRTISQIQGGVSVSPFNGLGVITRGIVTARYPAYFVVQDGSGPWNGLWVRSSATPAVGDSVTVRGLVTESDVQGLAGNTLLTSGLVLASSTGVTFPATALVSTATASSEASRS